MPSPLHLNPFSFFKKSKPPSDDMNNRPGSKPRHSTGGRTWISSDANGIAEQFGRLSLGSGDARRPTGRHSNEEFIGGFHPPPAPYRPDRMQGDEIFGFSTMPMPVPQWGPPPGPLPVPPSMPMQTAQTSRTMHYALYSQGRVPLGTPDDGTHPPTMTRPHSDSGALPSSSRLQLPPSTPHRPHLQQAPNSAPAKPVSSAPNSRPPLSALQTSSGRRRATSSPPSPSAGSSSSAASKGAAKVQCSGITKLDKRCTRMVFVTVPLARLNGENLPHYCHQHLKSAFEDVKFRSHKDPSEPVVYSEWVAEYLQEETQESLRKEMRLKHSPADESGYIYAFEIDDPTDPHHVHIKVGRAVKLTKRLAEWDKQCQSKQTHLRGFWPTTHEAEQGNLARGRVQVGDPGPYCHRVEKLVHLELADLAVNAPYLDPEFPNVKGTSGNGNGRVVSRAPCPDCGAIHKEIFSFPRATGRYKGKEWDEIVKPVIEKWGGFVELYV